MTRVSHFVAVAIVLAWAGLSSADGKDRIDGTWAFEVKDKSFSDSGKGERGFFEIDRQGDAISVRDLSTDRSYKGSIDSDMVTMEAHLYTNGKSKEVTLKGTVKDNEMRGSFSEGGRSVNWKATRLTSLWACTNHRPTAHFAASRMQIRSYMKANGCRGWHRVR